MATPTTTTPTASTRLLDIPTICDRWGQSRRVVDRVIRSGLLCDEQYPEPSSFPRKAGGRWRLIPEYLVERYEKGQAR